MANSFSNSVISWAAWKSGRQGFNMVDQRSRTEQSGMGKVVGIDLGTTYSVVAVIEGGKPVVIANAEGTRTTPSVVGFSKDGDRLVGQMARRQAEMNPQNTFYGVKRLLGCKYTELSPQAKQVPYTIRKDDNGNIKIRCPRQNREYTAEEISAMILRKLADEASRYLGQEVTGAVITVPAYFNDSQRQATRDAGRIAGLEVLRILNEPTAAALAYGLDKRELQTILVFDLGGGTFDVSILEVGDGVFEVKATSGDTQLGGNDFDRLIVNWLAEEFLKTDGIDLRKERQSLQRLTDAAEKAKIELSGMASTEINLPFITATTEGPKHIDTRLTRAQFEGMCGELLTRLQTPVKRVLADAKMSNRDIDEVVLVGGSTRIPAVQEVVRQMLDLRPNQNVNPDEVVAIGAAIQAGVLSREVQELLLLDVTPLTLGLETIGGLMKKLIPRNTTIPVRRSDTFSTSENNQTMVEIHVVQGEREMASDNKSLGRFKLTGIPPAPKGLPQVQVSLDIDANGILQVTAMDRTTGREQTITVQGSATLSEAEVQRMIAESEQYAAIDRQKKDKVERRNKAEALTSQAERRMREIAIEFGMQFASGQRRQVENLVRELRAALQDNNEREVDAIKTELEDLIYEINRQVRQLTASEDEGFFTTLKKTLLGDDDEFYDNRDYNRDYSSGRMLPPAANNYDPYRPNDYPPSSYPSGRGYDGDRSYNQNRNDYDRQDDSYDRRPRDDYRRPANNPRDSWEDERPIDRPLDRPRDTRRSANDYSNTNQPRENRRNDYDEYNDAPRRSPEERQPRSNEEPPRRRERPADNQPPRKPKTSSNGWDDEDEWY
jgi:molecular chaperone DnaK